MKDVLYAWACPANMKGFPWDHTWVTSYDSRVFTYPDIGTVIHNKSLYWYSWGKFHPKGQRHYQDTGYLGSASGDFSYSKCICEPNAKSKKGNPACGTIFVYAVDGLCHQLSNQILWSTASEGHRPLTVSKANGYRSIRAVYGDYGLNALDWEQKKMACHAPQSMPDQSAQGRSAMAELPRGEGRSKMSIPTDGFDGEALMVLKSFHEEDKLDSLLTLRRNHQAKLMELRRKAVAGVRMEASVINDMNNQFFRQAEGLIHPKAFEKLFGFPVETVVSFVDQDVMDMMNED